VGKSHPGITAENLMPVVQLADIQAGIVPFILSYFTTAGTASYSMFNGHAPFQFVVVGVQGVMTGAGGAGDTVVLNDISGNHITEVMNLAGLADNATFVAATIDNAYSMVNSWTGDLVVATASGATCMLSAICMRTIIP
jgi:hypothetical protein